MATSGVMADFARMPTSRKVMVFAVIGILLGLIYFRFVLKPLREDAEAAQGAANSKTTEMQKLEKDVPIYKDKQRTFKELKKKIEENQKALPTEAEVPAFFETLEHKVAEAGVEITSWKKRNEEAVDNFVKVPVEIELVGTFMEIKRFFASLVQKPGAKADERIVSIENLVVGNPQIKNKEVVLQAKFLAVTYRQEDKPLTPAPGTPGAPGATTTPGGRAAPQPRQATPSGSAPLPSPSTPAGAKANVEDSLKKSEERVDKVTPRAGSGSDRLKGGI
jgi:type IV pilus assembly protein PilO